ncbi:hypothetical protein [Rhodococcus pyridinivorans]|uniref:hypothetical protein n=1 Tax=Rhodococcus pyridinivorans TaxID=103816 RepID=UPI002284F4EC|nr:hypothetical protein [Rhodococcus pyridinivorans]WAL46790.1 hypothetical protein OQN32_01370 [Rhodococcus pyridinivorans]
MAGGYFGDELTCRHCDYPRRLHHLLRVDHEYTERPNENAPAPVAAGNEGTENQSNTYEGAESVNAKVQHTDDTATEPCGYVLTEAGAAALDMLERRAKTTAQESVVKADDRHARGHFPPLPYMTAFALGDDLHYASDRYRTPHVTIPLREYADYYAEDDDMIQLAAMRVGLFQRGDSTYPLVEFERMSGHDGDKKGPFARYELHLDEVEQLAHALLLLLDVARGVTDEGRPN